MELQTDRGQFGGGAAFEPAKEQVASPILVFDGLERWKTILAEVIDEDRVGLGDAELNDRLEARSQRRLAHSDTATGARRQTPWPL